MTDRPVYERRKRSVAVPILALICIIAVTACIVMYIQYKGNQNNADAEQTALVTTINKTVELPDGKPTIVTVTDKNKLSNKALAGRVQNKDMLLIYADAKRIVVYRPSSKKVVDMLTLALAETKPSPTPVNP